MKRESTNVLGNKGEDADKSTDYEGKDHEWEKGSDMSCSGEKVSHLWQS
jgi:hypothetical protein